MYSESFQPVLAAARKKVELLHRSKSSYLLSSMLAGAYIGIGIALIFSVGAPLAQAGSAFVRPLMGVSFGIALTLVVFAGAELFTGNNMIMAIGVLHKEVSGADLVKVWGLSWVGNLLGSSVLALLVVASGSLEHASEFIAKVAAAKMSAPALQLFTRGILCNWLVCLALWMSARAKTDTAKCILIFWCLYAFIASGFEHSVANMSLLVMALFVPHGEAVSWVGFGNNLLFVTLGNIVGGALFVGGLYWLLGRSHQEE